MRYAVLHSTTTFQEGGLEESGTALFTKKL